MKRPALQNKRVGVEGMAFRARKLFGTFEKRERDVEGRVWSWGEVWLNRLSLSKRKSLFSPHKP